MPFTLAHPIVALPLRRTLGRYGVLSALVVGSLIPDLWYFMPFQTSRHYSHTWPGLISYCLPAGLGLYLLYHLVLKDFLSEYLPGPWRARFAPLLRSGLHGVPWAGVVLCLLLGSATHLALDSFTHKSGWMVQHSPLLQVSLFQAFGTHLRVYKLLQYSLSLLGPVVLAAALFKAYPAMGAEPATCQGMSSRCRLIATAALTIAPLALAIAFGYHHAMGHHGLDAVRLSAGGAIHGGGMGLLGASLVVGMLCKATHLRARGG